MSTRVRLVLLLLLCHLVISVVVGGTAWWLIDRERTRQHLARAEAVERLFERGGFPQTDEVRQRIADLAGVDLAAGVVSAGDRATIIATPHHEAGAAMALAIAAAVFLAGGTILFAVAAWWTTQVISSPLHRLASAARRLGAGGLADPVPVTGSGEIADLARDLEDTRQRLITLQDAARRQERLATLGTFAATIAHEVRNPLSAIRIAAQLAQRDAPHHAGARMLDEIERLDLVVDELLAFTRGMTVQVATIEAHVEVDAVLRLLDHQAAHAGVRLRRIGEARILADGQRLRQLLMNLVLNGIQAQHLVGGLVDVVLDDAGLRVIDDGPGVSPELVPALFTPFTSARDQGTGLGLHLAKAVADAHGWSLAYEPRKPRGASFRVGGIAVG